MGEIEQVIIVGHSGEYNEGGQHVRHPILYAYVIKSVKQSK